MKVYTLLTTSNRFALPGFVKLCRELKSTGVTILAPPQCFAPDPQTAAKIQQQITDLSKKESDAAQNKVYTQAAAIRQQITLLDQSLKQLQEQASAYYIQETKPIQDILATVVLDRDSWKGDALVTEENFPDQINHISTKLLSTGIRGNKHVTPLHKRTYIPLGSLEFSPSQLVAQVAVVPMAMDSVVGDVSQSETPPSGLQAADDYLVDLLEPETTSNDGIPNSLSPNQRSFVEAILKKEASNFAQASNVAGLSPSSTKKVVTDITKKWPEFPQFISAYIKIENEPQTLEEV